MKKVRTSGRKLFFCIKEGTICRIEQYCCAKIVGEGGGISIIKLFIINTRKICRGSEFAPRVYIFSFLTSPPYLTLTDRILQNGNRRSVRRFRKNARLP